MRHLAKLGASIAGLAGALGAAGAALAQQPTDWEVDFQTALSPSMERIVDFNLMVTIIIVIITAFVFGLMAWIVVRYNKKRNPVPSKTTHNTMLEVIWTVVPVIILLVIAVPSFRLLYFTDRVEEADMTLKAIGHQWYWSYEYPDHGDFTFDAIMLEEDELEEGQPRLLATDEAVVLPVGAKIRLLTTADDVIHSWAIPAFGVKMDSVPGRVNETWFQINREGTYYGQCSELCGTLHGFMPIMIEAVSQEEFDAWVEFAREEYAAADETPTEVAALDTGAPLAR
ncbi:MAG: cytochrome c oxidase subunit II [Rhodospirillaceae bacterium]|nr:cytochrome c oxidase subunit II [Rhodospirillaceae bacterium]